MCPYRAAMMFPQTPFAGVHNNLGVVGGVKSGGIGGSSGYSHNPFAPDPRTPLSPQGSVNYGSNFHPMFNSYHPVGVIPQDGPSQSNQKNPSFSRRRSGTIGGNGLYRNGSSNHSFDTSGSVMVPEWLSGMLLSPSNSHSASLRQGGMVPAADEQRAAADRSSPTRDGSEGFASGRRGGMSEPLRPGGMSPDQSRVSDNRPP